MVDLHSSIHRESHCLNHFVVAHSSFVVDTRVSVLSLCRSFDSFLSVSLSIFCAIGEGTNNKQRSQ